MMYLIYVLLSTYINLSITKTTKCMYNPKPTKYRNLYENTGSVLNLIKLCLSYNCVIRCRWPSCPVTAGVFAARAPGMIRISVDPTSWDKDSHISTWIQRNTCSRRILSPCSMIKGIRGSGGAQSPQQASPSM